MARALPLLCWLAAISAAPAAAVVVVSQHPAAPIAAGPAPAAKPSEGSDLPAIAIGLMIVALVAAGGRQPRPVAS